VDVCVQTIQDRLAWDKFVTAATQHTFLQSWGWGVFYAAMGHRVFRLGVCEADRLVGAALFVKYHLRRGSFLFCPHGPLLDWERPAHWEALLAAASELGQREHVVYVRISPTLAPTPEHSRIFETAGFIPAPVQLHVENTWTLDLRDDEPALLAAMRRNTRNGIRIAQREGVTVTESHDPADLTHFHALYAETAGRDHFEPMPRGFIDLEARTFLAADQAAIFLARCQGEVLAAVIVIFYGAAAYAHFGASSSRRRKAYAPYLLQWEIIRAARRRGCTRYDLWGIAPTQDPTHRWAGFSFFKRGFSGSQVDYLHAQDLPLKSSYWLTHLIETLRRRRQGQSLW